MNLEDGKCGCKSLPAPPQNCHLLEQGGTILGAVFTLKNYPLKKKSELLSVSLQTGPMWSLSYGHKIPLKKKSGRIWNYLGWNASAAPQIQWFQPKNSVEKWLQRDWFACFSAEICEKISICLFLPVNVQPSLEARSKRKL